MSPAPVNSESLNGCSYANVQLFFFNEIKRQFNSLGIVQERIPLGEPKQHARCRIEKIEDRKKEYRKKFLQKDAPQCALLEQQKNKKEHVINQHTRRHKKTQQRTQIGSSRQICRKRKTAPKHPIRERKRTTQRNATDVQLAAVPKKRKRLMAPDACALGIRSPANQ